MKEGQKPRVLPYSYENSRDFDRREPRIFPPQGVRREGAFQRKSNVFVISEIIREVDPEMKGAFGFRAAKEYCERTK